MEVGHKNEMPEGREMRGGKVGPKKVYQKEGRRKSSLLQEPRIQNHRKIFLLFNPKLVSESQEQTIQKTMNKF